MHEGVVGLDHARLARAASEQPAFQRGLVQLGRRFPIDSGGTGQAEVLGHSLLGDVQAARDTLVREAALGLGSRRLPYDTAIQS
ncbi:hypothetical protein D8B34_26545 [Verminephrobacter eiseniae]|nr:hypothetical protein [Verminephrobacter eiseniae]MCW8188005.1 hypothetical protein [Verminephrobacter eiseniae]MCW8226091.1 hypothetical protein [Verminephrobacter eiseniae]MCW8237120.1 hypothetical protein [Verminephrobacter eiseniae]